jgi:hypothetical protein
LEIIEKHGNSNVPIQITERSLCNYARLYKAGFNQEMIDEHLYLLMEKGLIRAEETQLGYLVLGLTWEGHDFVSNASNPTVWEKAKACAGNLSFDIFKAMLTKVAEKAAESILNSVVR